MRWPHVFGKPILEWTPRHDSLDPLRLRWRTWVLVARTLPTLLRRHPFGRRPLGRDLRRYITATGAKIQDDHAFMEPLEIVYEYGVFGVVAVVGLWALIGRSVLGNPDGPYAAALLVWALTMTGSVTGRTYPFPILGALLGLGRWAS